MGLDMYLYAERYVGGWKHELEKERKAFDAIKRAIGFSPSEASPHFA